MDKKVKWIIIWSLSVFYSIVGAIKLLYTIARNGWQVLEVKDRLVRPSILTDERFGKHHYVVLEKRGLRLHYVEKGNPSAPLIVLIHGFPECWLTWRNQLENLSENYRVVAVDLPGYGDSDKPTKKDSYLIDCIAEDLKQFILTLGVTRQKPCFLVAHDWGSIIGWALVEYYPELFRKHIGIGGQNMHVREKVLFTSIVQFFKSWYVFYLQMPYLPEMTLRQNDLEYYAEILRGPDNDVKAFPDEVIEAYKYYFSKKGGFTGPANYYRRLFHNDVKNMKEKIQVPTLIVWAGNDTAISTDVATQTLPLCEKAELKIVKRGGHFLPEYEHEAITAIIREYLQR